MSWFHEQRRRYLSEVKLEGDERASACADAVAVLQGLAEATQRLDRLAELADLVAHATGLLSQSGHLTAAVGLDRRQLALCASLVELIEPGMQFRAIDGNLLLRHTRQVFQPSGDLVQAFRELGSSTLVQIIERDHGAVAAPSFNDLLVMLVIIGRAQRDLGRTPIPTAASAVFSTVIRPRLGSFLGAGYGIGYVRIAALGEQSVAQRPRLSTPHFVGGRDTGPNLLLRGRYSGRSFYVHASFDSIALRDEAFNQLDGLEAEIFDQPFEVIDLLRHPVDPVPANRFLNAAQRLVGNEMRLDADGASATRNLASPLRAEQRLSIRADVMRVVRARSSLIECYATELDKPIGFLYFEDGDSTEIAEVIGGREDARAAPRAFARPRDDPFEIYRLEELGDLEPHERIGIATHSLSRVPHLSDPAVETLTGLAKRAVRFNATQRQLVLSLDETDLQLHIEAAVNTCLEDARALYATGVFGDGIDPPGPMAYEVVLAPAQDGAVGLFGGGWSSGRVITRATSEEHDVVCLKVVERRLSRLADELPTGDYLECTQSSADHIIAGLLGYRPQDLCFSGGSPIEAGAGAEPL